MLAWVSLLPKSGLCHLFLGLNCVTKPPVGGALWNTTSFHCCFWAGAVLLQTSREFRRNQRQCELHNKCACKQRQRHSPIAAAHGLCWSWEKGSQEVKEGRVDSLLLDGDWRANWMWTENCATKNSLDSWPCLTQFFFCCPLWDRQSCCSQNLPGCVFPIVCLFMIGFLSVCLRLH